MSLQPIMNRPVYGIAPGTLLGLTGRRGPRELPSPSPAPRSEPGRPSAFEGLVRIWQDNERLLNEQNVLCHRLQQAREYLSAPGGNLRLGMAHLSHVKVKHSVVLARLRTNRREADRILAAIDPEYGTAYAD